MSTGRNTVAQALNIALIVFVMLTFVLAITTYLFFSQREDFKKQAKEATTTAEKATTDKNATDDFRKKLQELIGYPEEKIQSDIETDVNNLFAGKLDDFIKDKPKTFVDLTDALLATIQEKNEQIKMSKQDLAKAAAEMESKEANANIALTKKDEVLKKLETDRAEEKKTFDEEIVSTKKISDEILAKQKKSDERSRELDGIKEEILKAKSLVSIKIQKDFSAKTSAEQVGLVLAELRERDKKIVETNSLLATLDAASPEAQAAVRATRPKDERIRQIDGRIAVVDELLREVIVEVPTTRSMRPGLFFEVFHGDEPAPLVSSKKGIIEVIRLEGPTSVRARISKDSNRDLIVAGDVVASSLWDPDRQLQIVVVGFVQLDNDPASDLDQLKGVIAGIGGVLVEEQIGVTLSTSLVVDAGKPDSKNNKEASRRDRAIKEAQRVGVRVVDVDRFLDMAGRDRESLEGRSLPAVSSR